MSLKGTGTFAKTLTYQGRAGSTAVFLRKSPYDPKSPGQLAIRQYVTQGVYYWRSMGGAYQTLWNNFVN
jgi:hypothetical protein